IVVANQLDFSIGVFMGYGDGTFDKQKTFSTGFYSFPSAVVFGDFNNDNQSDIVVSNSGTNNFQVFLIQYSADFTSQAVLDTGSRPHPYSIAIGDFNTDSQLDIAVANSGNDNLEILLNYNKTVFMNKTIYPTGFGSHSEYVTTADMNKDNKLDILM